MNQYCKQSVETMGLHICQVKCDDCKDNSAPILYTHVGGIRTEEIKRMVELLKFIAEPSCTNIELIEGQWRTDDEDDPETYTEEGLVEQFIQTLDHMLTKTHVGEDSWIRTIDRLPEIGHPVIVRTEYFDKGRPAYQTFTGYRDEEGELIIHPNDVPYGWSFSNCVVCWMPFPAYEAKSLRPQPMEPADKALPVEEEEPVRAVPISVIKAIEKGWTEAGYSGTANDYYVNGAALMYRRDQKELSTLRELFVGWRELEESRNRLIRELDVLINGDYVGERQLALPEIGAQLKKYLPDLREQLAFEKQLVQRQGKTIQELTEQLSNSKI